MYMYRNVYVFLCANITKYKFSDKTFEIALSFNFYKSSTT